MDNIKNFSKYSTPAGMDDLLLEGDGDFLTGVFFAKASNIPCHPADGEFTETPVLRETRAWLDEYFAGRQPAYIPKYRISSHATPFRLAVLEVMKPIPYGKTTTYGAIAETLAAQFHKDKMSAQAVGQAVGWNPLCILIPCHRVIGANGSMTGYGGGLKNKIALLRHEGVLVTK